MGLTREILLRASTSEWLAHQLARRKFTRNAVQRFLPGEDVESALDAAGALRESGIPTILTLLGERDTSWAHWTALPNAAATPTSRSSLRTSGSNWISKAPTQGSSV
jgi:hypothetical protein